MILMGMAVQKPYFFSIRDTRQVSFPVIIENQDIFLQFHGKTAVKNICNFHLWLLLFLRGSIAGDIPADPRSLLIYLTKAVKSNILYQPASVR